uniref:Uncharacterized protein n=2 Tax=Micrurus TaxID=8634 RepID=A0A2D4GTI9_MICCO
MAYFLNVENFQIAFQGRILLHTMNSFVKSKKWLSHPDPNITFHCNKYTSLNMVIVYYLFKSFWITNNYILSLDFASVTLKLASDELCLSIHFLIELIFNLFPESKY